MNLKNETGAAMAASRSAYEAKVGVEAVLRSGGKIRSSRALCTRSSTGTLSP